MAKEHPLVLESVQINVEVAKQWKYIICSDDRQYQFY